MGFIYGIKSKYLRKCVEKPIHLHPGLATSLIVFISGPVSRFSIPGSETCPSLEAEGGW